MIVFAPNVATSLYTPPYPRFKTPTRDEIAIPDGVPDASRGIENKLLRKAKKDVPFTSNFLEGCNSGVELSLGESADPR
jgi:hypothetical protein